MLPVGLPNSERTSLHSTRPLCLTPHGLSINSAVKLVLDDLHHSAVHGVPAVDAMGRHVRVFIDTTALFGDFPQAAAFRDVLGLRENARCSLCHMRRRKHQNIPETNFSVETHGGRPSFVRFNARRSAIRHVNHDKGILRALGMKFDNPQAAEELPAVTFAATVARSEQKFERSDGTPVVPYHLDHALSVPVLPDHLLSSMTAYVMRACFKELPSNDVRSEVEMRIIKATNDNGLDVKSNILSWDRSKRGMRYNGVAST